MIIVAALPQEVEGLPFPIQLTGVGKVNASRVMVESIMRNQPNQVVNFGTAAKCSKKVEVGKIYELGTVVQGDMFKSMAKLLHLGFTVLLLGPPAVSPALMSMFFSTPPHFVSSGPIRHEFPSESPPV